MDDKYINKLKQCKNKHITLKKADYSHPVPKYIKGYMLDRFYTPEEYELLDYKVLSTGT